MDTGHIIAADLFSAHHQIEITFIHRLHDYGLLELTMIDGRPYLALDQLPALERMIRLHYDLDINIPGIETITHLLERNAQLKEEVRQLKNRLSIYNG